jgi:uncharacterized protein YqjF (DUF2071 family)
MTSTPQPITRAVPPGTVPHTVFRQAWTRLAFLHWRYDPAVLAPLLPAGTRPDIVDGSAWVGLIPFHMRRVAILGTPPLPYVSSFLETNVRTYSVGPDGKRGVVFLTLEANRLAPVVAARLSYRLPYTWARMSMRQDGDAISYASRRIWPADPGATTRVRIRVGAPIEADEVDDALTARWGLHSTWWGHRSVWAPVDHEPWPLRAATVEDLDPALVTAVGLPAPEGEPRVLWSEGVSVRIGPPRRI